MKTICAFLFAILLLAGCNTMKPALSEAETISYPVKGRQGLLINQKLKFGDYETSKVKRSWTRGGNTRLDLLAGTVNDPNSPGLMVMEYDDRKQSYYFQMQDFFGNFSDVYGTSEYHSRDLKIGDNPNSIINIFEDIFGKVDYSDNLFYLQLYINEESKPWQLMLDNHASQAFAKNYYGVLAIDGHNYYSLKPITEVKSKNGKTGSLFMGSVGYEIFNSKNESVAGVSLIDGGEVYLHTQNPDERFLLANLCAALLLQENIAE
jgi:hypothetical protein